jgi:hypothetical protein
MDTEWKQRTHQYVQSRRQHPAWQLLAARSAPLVLSCLQTLFEKSHDGIEIEAAERMLAALLEQHANSEEFGVDPEDDCSVLARKELRSWIRRSLLIERGGRLYATDALEEALCVRSSRIRVNLTTCSRRRCRFCGSLAYGQLSSKRFHGRSVMMFRSMVSSLNGIALHGRPDGDQAANATFYALTQFVFGGFLEEQDEDATDKGRGDHVVRRRQR